MDASKYLIERINRKATRFAWEPCSLADGGEPRLAIGCANGDILIWSKSQCKPLQNKSQWQIPRTHWNTPIVALDWHPTEPNLLLNCSSCIFALTHTDGTNERQIGMQGIECGGFSYCGEYAYVNKGPDGNQLYRMRRSDIGWFWDTSFVIDHDERIVHLKIGEDGLIMTTDESGLLKACRIVDGQPTQEQEFQMGNRGDIIIARPQFWRTGWFGYHASNLGKRFMIVSENGSCIDEEVSNAHIAKITAISWSSCGHYIATSSEDDTTAIWDAKRMIEDLICQSV